MVVLGSPSREGERMSPFSSAEHSESQPMRPEVKFQDQPLGRKGTTAGALELEEIATDGSQSQYRGAVVLRKPWHRETSFGGSFPSLGLEAVRWLLTCRQRHLDRQSWRHQKREAIPLPKWRRVARLNGCGGWNVPLRRMRSSQKPFDRRLILKWGTRRAVI